jgi:ribonucleoside-diphosphate reductase alpha chain/ribonucleoside-triphosphate reductase
MITPEFLATYNDKKTPWGFGGLGEVVYARTYSRKKDDGTFETWPETIARCINGAVEVGTPYSKEQAEELFDHMFNLRCSFSGRALWQLGTPLVRNMGAASLNNCYHVDITSIEDFEFLFDMLMVGGGVGYSVERHKIHDLPKVKAGIKISHERSNDADVIVPDKREGWSRLLHSVLKSYLYTGKSFTYSTILIREFGAPLSTFGGTASGPGALVDGIADICKVLDGRIGAAVTADGDHGIARRRPLITAADPHLRFGDESQVRPFQELPGVAEACAASAFARLVFERLRELRPA